MLKLLTSGFLIASGLIAITYAPPGGCRLTVTNNGSDAAPVYAFACQGECVVPAQDPCTVDFMCFTGEDSQPAIMWFCECDGQGITSSSKQACYSNVNNNGGSWSINCGKAECTNDCLGARLPVKQGSTVFACTCPDV